MGNSDHMAARDHLPVHRTLCTKCRSWILQPAARFQQRIIHTKSVTNLLQTGLQRNLLPELYSHPVCIPVRRLI